MADVEQNQALVRQRKGRYMAQLLDLFERQIEPHVPASVAQEFKGECRRKLNALSVDACDVIFLMGTDQLQNGHAIAIKDRLFVDGQAQRSKT